MNVMPYLLHHHFDPDFDHTQLQPREMADGTVDHYDLNYVQNVIQGQVLAELREIPSDEALNYESRFVRDTPDFPLGRNCSVNPDNPNQLLADANGFALYEDDVISVRRTLNIRRDVDFHSGNILFVGDMVVHGNVRAGFDIKARNILVKGLINAAGVAAQENVVTETGIKGGNKAVIEAGKSIRAPFCENALLKAGQDVLIDGGCLNCELYVKGRLAVKGRFMGGVANCTDHMLVSEVIGGGSMGMDTEVHLGFDPFLTQQLDAVDETLDELNSLLSHYKAEIARGEAHEEEFAPKILKVETKLESLKKKRDKLDILIQETSLAHRASLLVPGEVRPGVIVTIGGVALKINDYYSDVRFTLQDGEIQMSSPALGGEQE